MNSATPLHKITSFPELQAERTRLEELIKQQKILIRLDIDMIRDHLKTEMKPAIDAANVVKKFTAKETRTSTLIETGSNLVVDILLRKLFVKSNFFIQLFVPTLVKNYSTNIISNLMKKRSQKRQIAIRIEKQNGHYLPE